MRKRLLFAGMAAAISILPAAALDVDVPPGYKLVWHDEFEGSVIDPASWTFDLGAGGWGNGEAERYTSRSENARLEGGALVIEARQEKYQGSYYTSARMKTQGLRAFKYGRIEARMRVPAGKGLWPAFWLLGSDIAEVGWPACGEIDVMEYIGKDPSGVYGTAHGPGYSGTQGLTKRLDAGFQVADDFHAFAIEWDASGIRWYFDGKEYLSVSKADVGGKAWVFDKGFFIILNLAVGGSWPGLPALDTPFPARLLVDYVRVFEKAE